MPQLTLRVKFDIKEFYYLKRDGSISHGFEIVTHPHQFEAFFYQLFPFDNIFNSNMNYVTEESCDNDDDDDYDDYDYSNTSLFQECGMHIHLSKSAFSNAHLYKFVKFFAEYPKYIEMIAERPANNYCYTEKKLQNKTKGIN